MTDRLKYPSASILSRIVGRFFLFPSIHTIDPGNAVERLIAVGGAVLSVFVARSPGCKNREPDVFVLELSGNGARAERITAPSAKWWDEHPVQVWGVNYPGFAGSTGPSRLGSLTQKRRTSIDPIGFEKSLNAEKR